MATASANGAFIDTSVRVPGAADGPLVGCTFGSKDLFDVEGHRTGFGHPRWLETHPEAAAHAPAVQALLSAGAELAGKTAMDELAYSLNGENHHYGTPVNPACPDRVPGGSSSGSAVAVASRAVDVGLGSDTAGSVRVPASYCGVYGMRPTWGRVSLEGACALSPSYDTGGWFTRSAELLQRVGHVLLATGDAAAAQPLPLPSPRWLVATDGFALADKAATDAIYQALSGDFEGVTGVLGAPTEVEVGGPAGDLAAYMDVFRVTQGAEVWACHGEWITREEPEFGPGVRERFGMASRITREEVDSALARRQAMRDHVWGLLGSDGVLAVPSAPGPAPLINLPAAELDAFRKRLISLTVIASLCQLPQVTIPLAKVDGCPVGLGLIGPRGSDEALLDITRRLAAVLGLP